MEVKFDTNIIEGCLIGGAIGDCMGAPYENQDSAHFDDSKSWYTTDDTQLTMATCESIIKKKRVDPAHIAESMAAWFCKGKIRGIGAGTLKALTEISAGGHWALVGRKGEYAAGNGAAIRIAPLAFFTDPNSESGRQLIRDVARITHHNDEAYIGALAMIFAIQAASKSEFHLAGIPEKLPDSCVRDRLLELSKTDPSTAIRTIAKDFGNTGYAVDSVPLALFTAAKIVHGASFKSTLIELVESGGDTDSIASMAGQVAGAGLGIENLEPSLTARVLELKKVKRIAKQITHTLTNLKKDKL